MTDYSEVIKELQMLNEPGSLLPQGVSEDKVRSFEAQINTRLPLVLRDWLMLTNAPGVGGQYLMGIDAKPIQDMMRLLNLYPKWLEAGWLPVAGDGLGNFYVVTTKQDFGSGEPVIFLDHEFDTAQPDYIVASAFDIFVKQFVHKELVRNRWPFDKSLTLSIDPGIMAFKSISMPWD